MDPDQQLRNLRDFLLVYNRMTEICFQRCTSNFNYRNLTMDEEHCVDSCAGKLIRSNHRLMGTYVQLMPRMMQRRMEEIESKAAENAKAEAAASASITPPATETLPESPASVASSPPLPVSAPQQVPQLTDVRPDDFGSVLTPVGSDVPQGIDSVMPSSSTSTISTEVKLSAAAPFTPAAEVVNLPVLHEAANGPSVTAGFPPAPPAESGGSAPELMPSKMTSLSVDVPVSTVAAPAGSISTESKPLPGHQVPPQTGQ